MMLQCSATILRLGRAGIHSGMVSRKECGIAPACLLPAPGGANRSMPPPGPGAERQSCGLLLGRSDSPIHPKAERGWQQHSRNAIPRNEQAAVTKQEAETGTVCGTAGPVVEKSNMELRSPYVAAIPGAESEGDGGDGAGRGELAQEPRSYRAGQPDGAAVAAQFESGGREDFGPVVAAHQCFGDRCRRMGEASPSAEPDPFNPVRRQGCDVSLRSMDCFKS